MENSEWADFLSSTSTLNSITGFMALAMTCKVYDCPYASKCPIVAHLKSLSSSQAEIHEAEIIDKPCRLDRVEAAKELISRCREYGVTPQYTTDLGHVMTIVQLQQIKRKILWELQDYGMMIDSPAFEVKTQGTVVFKKEVNPLLHSLSLVDAQIQKVETALQATRKDKAQFMSNNADVIRGAMSVLKERHRREKINPDSESDEVVDV